MTLETPFEIGDEVWMVTGSYAIVHCEVEGIRLMYDVIDKTYKWTVTNYRLDDDFAEGITAALCFKTKQQAIDYIRDQSIKIIEAMPQPFKQVDA